MNVTFNRAALVDALRTLSKLVQRTSCKPILRCVRIEAFTDHAEIAGTDLMTAANLRVAQVQAEPQAKAA